MTTKTFETLEFGMASPRQALQPTFSTAGAMVEAPVSDVSERVGRRSERRSGLLGRRLLRALVAVTYLVLLSGYGYWVSAGGHQPPPPLTRVN